MSLSESESGRWHYPRAKQMPNIPRCSLYRQIGIGTTRVRKLAHKLEYCSERKTLPTVLVHQTHARGSRGGGYTPLPGVKDSVQLTARRMITNLSLCKAWVPNKNSGTEIRRPQQLLAGRRRLHPRVRHRCRLRLQARHRFLSLLHCHPRLPPHRVRLQSPRGRILRRQ